MFKKVAFTTLTLAAALAAPSALAEPPPPQPPAKQATPAPADPPFGRLEPDTSDGVLAADVVVTVAGIAAWGGTEVAKAHLAPLACRWCNVPGIDDSVRKAFVWPANRLRAADGLGNVVGFVLVPTAAIGFALATGVQDQGHAVRHAFADFFVIAESAAVAMDINQLTKFVVGRQRPYVHFKTDTGTAADYNLSFFSGHTTLAFSLATATGMVATLRGYRFAPWIWAGGMAIATALGYLRIAADRHYFTDVLMGSATGAAVGVIVPYLHRKPPPVMVAAAPSRDGGTIALTGTW